MTTKPTPSLINKVKYTFNSVAEMVAEDNLRASDDYVQTLGYYNPGDGGGNIYQIKTSSYESSTPEDGGWLIDLDNGRRAEGLFPSSYNPVQWGAYGDGTNDDTTAIQACFDYAVSDKAHNLIVGPKAIVDGLGKQYAVSAGLFIYGGSDGMVFRDFSFLAIGTGWDSATDYLVTNNSTYSDFYSMGLNCNHKCRGWNDSSGSGRARHWSIQIMAMAEVGYHKSGGGGELRMFGGQITQYISSDEAVDTLAKQGNYDAIGLLIEESDCKIHDTNVRWCGTCYKSTGGQQYLYNCHFVQGTGGRYARTNAQLIDWNPASGTGNGELFIKGCYLDNGYVDLYDDRVNIEATVLVDVNDVGVTEFFRFYSYTGVGECQANMDIRFSQWDGSVQLFDWIDEGATSWPDDYSTIISQVQDQLSGGAHQDKVITLHNTWNIASTNANGVGVNLFTNNTRSVLGFADLNTTGSRPRVGSKGDNVLVQADNYLEANVLGILMNANSVEPAGASNYAIAMSDGTSSTNGFGGTGAGLYIRLSGTWTQL